MPIPSFTGKSSLGTQIVFIKDGNIFSDDQPADTDIPMNITDINNQTKGLLPEGDSIEYSHVTEEPDRELQRFLDEKN